MQSGLIFKKASQLTLKNDERTNSHLADTGRAARPVEKPSYQGAQSSNDLLGDKIKKELHFEGAPFVSTGKWDVYNGFVAFGLDRCRQKCSQ